MHLNIKKSSNLILKRSRGTSLAVKWLRLHTLRQKVQFDPWLGNWDPACHIGRPKRKRAEDLNGHVSKENIQMASRHPKRCLSLISQSIQLLSHVQFFATPWIAAPQASLSITNSPSLLKLMSIESVMPSNQLIPCHPLLLASIFPHITVFSNESALPIR